MPEFQEITDQKDLKELEILWSDWVNFEKELITAMHVIIGCAKSPIQNPCKLPKELLLEYIKKVHSEKKLAFSKNEINFDKLLEKTVGILKKHTIKGV
jgi:hypothetical protein